MDTSKFGFETRAIRAGQDPSPGHRDTVIPIHVTSTYTMREFGDFEGYEYSRGGNPTRDALNECLASLEGGRFCHSFSTGMAATTAVFHQLQPGDGVVTGLEVYGGTFRVLEEIFRPWGLEIAYAESETVEGFRAALGKLKRPKMVWLETPTNPMMTVTDIEAVAADARKAGALTVVDNTFASPYLQQPLRFGADIVVHSMTKYLGGHSDVLGGSIILNDEEMSERIHFYQKTTGAILGAFDSYLTLRGCKTLAVRMERHCDNAERLAEALRTMPGIKHVNFPGFADHPGHATAKKQMRRFGGMMSALVEGGEEGARRVLNRLRIFQLAQSLGGVESLVGHPSTMSHGSMPEEDKKVRGIEDGLIRISVGIESVDDLIADFRQALS